MDKIYKVGIIGCGGISRMHANWYKSAARAEMVAGADISEEGLKKFSEEYGLEKSYTDYIEMLEKEQPDIVSICTRPKQHSEITIECAKRGVKGILCEKPMGEDLGQADAMIEACEENNVKFQMGFNQRFWNQVEIAKQLVEKGTIGQVKGFSSTFKVRVSSYPADTDYRFQTELSGGSCLIDAGIHRIDMARFFMGDIKDVYAEVKHSVVPQKVDDNAWLLCNFESEATGFISSDIYSPTMDNTTALYGSEGTIYISTETVNPFQSVPLAVYTEKDIDQIPDIVLKYFYPKVWWDQPKDNWISIVPPRDFPYLKQLKAFYKSIIEDKEPPVTGDDGVKSLEVVLAAYKSAREKVRVTLPLQEEVVEPPVY